MAAFTLCNPSTVTAHGGCSLHARLNQMQVRLSECFLLDVIPGTKKSRCSVHWMDAGVLRSARLLVFPSGGGESAQCHRGDRWAALWYVRICDPARDLQGFSRDSKPQEGYQGPLVFLSGGLASRVGGGVAKDAFTLAVSVLLCPWLVPEDSGQLHGGYHHDGGRILGPDPPHHGEDTQAGRGGMSPRPSTCVPLTGECLHCLGAPTNV